MQITEVHGDVKCNGIGPKKLSALGSALVSDIKL